MAGPVTTGSFPKALWPGIKKWYAQAYTEHPEEYIHLFDYKTSDKNFEEEVQLVGLGNAPEKGEGESVIFDFMQQGFIHRAVNIAYGLGFIITYEEIRDNLYMNLGEKRSKALAFSMRQTKEETGANIYNRAFNSSFTSNPGDGKELIATDHPLIGGGTASNEPAADVDLNESAIEDACIAIMNYVNDRNQKISMMPVCLIIPPALWFIANRILKGTERSGTADRDINALNMTGAIPQVKVNHYLTDTDAWFIRTNAPDGLNYYDRESASFDQDNEFATKNFRAAAYERYAFNWTDWRQLYGSQGA